MDAAGVRDHSSEGTRRWQVGTRPNLRWCCVTRGREGSAVRQPDLGCHSTSTYAPGTLTSMHTFLPALLAIAAAALMALGTVIRQRASAEGGKITARWWLGAGTAFGGLLLQAAALAVGAVLLVQPLIVLSVLFTLPVEKWLAKRDPSAREWLWGVLLAAGVSIFIGFTTPVPARIGPHRWVLILVVGVLLAMLAALVVFAERSPRAPRALVYGVVSGSLFGIVAVLIHSVGRNFNDPVHVLTHPGLYLIIVVGLAAVYCQQRAFAAGNLQASFPAMTVAEPVVSMILGLALLGEKLNRHSWATVIGLLGLALMIAGVVRLSQLTARDLKKSGSGPTAAGAAVAVDQGATAAIANPASGPAASAMTGPATERQAVAARSATGQRHH